MEKGIIYGTDDIQKVWKQFAIKPRSIQYSADNGLTWNEVPSMDTGKWAKYDIVDGNIVEWVYRLKST